MLSWLLRRLRRPTPTAAAAAAPDHLASLAHPATSATGAAPASPVNALLEDADTPDAALLRLDILDRRRAASGYLFALQDQIPEALKQHSAQVRELLERNLIGRLAALAPHWPAGREAWLPLSPTACAWRSLDALAALRAVLWIRPIDAEQRAPAELAGQLQRLQKKGLRIALEAQPGAPWFESLAWLADRLVLRVAEREPNELRRLAQGLNDKHPMVPRVAFEVPNLEALELAQRLGCESACGAFSRARGDWQGKQMAPEHLRVAALLSRVGSDSENHEIAAVLKQDLALSYRLLRYVNASASGLQTPAASIEQALLLLGREPLQRWLSLLFFASLNAEAEGEALMESALVRARMLELLALRCAPEARDELFILGLFSLLDLMLKLPMATAIEPLHLGAELAAALRGEASPYLRYLALAEACERGDLACLLREGSALGLRALQVNKLHFEALAWVHTVADSLAEAAPAGGKD